MAVAIVTLLVAASLLLQNRLAARDAVEVSDAPVAGGDEPTAPMSVGVTAPGRRESPTTSTTVKATTGRGATTTTMAGGVTPPTTGPPMEPWDFKVELSKSCAVAGDAVTITFHLVENSVAGMMAVYSDSSTRKETNKTGAAGPDGRFVYSWNVDAGMPPGEVILTTMAYDGRRGGKKAVPFRIGSLVEPC